jgi:hypothetical protein
LHAIATDSIKSIAQDQPQALDVALAVCSAKCFVITPESLDGGEFTMEFWVKSAGVMRAQIA